MKKTKFSLLMAGLMVVGAMAPSAVMAADNDTAQVAATILIPISVAKSIDMNFGYILPGTIGTVTLATDGARTASGPTLIGGITPTAAKFAVTGDGTATFSISYAGSLPALTRVSGSETMAISFISEAKAGSIATPTPVSSGSATAGTLGAGAAVIYAGGVLSVAAAQVPGVYNGSLVVTVAYN